VPPGRRARRRTNLADPERLEARDLLAFSTLGFSLPDLQVTGEAGPRAAWGGPLTVMATVLNTGSSTITNPIAQAPGNPTTADAAASTVTVLLTPHRAFNNVITLGTFQAGAVPQNNLEQLTQTFTLPGRPPGFHGGRGQFYVRLVTNINNTVLESDTSNNVSPPIPVKLAPAALPELSAVALYTPPVMQPGDTIAPTISIENLGTAPSGTPVQVALVASTTRSFTVGSSIVALYNINTSIPAASQVPTAGSLGDLSQNVNLPSNITTFTGPAVTLPTSPARYFLGVVVDPFGKIPQLRRPGNAFSQIQVVGPPIPNLPPAGVVSTPNSNPFPEPASGNLIGVVSTTTTGVTSPTITSARTPRSLFPQ
jgi:hypothetical protein